MSQHNSLLFIISISMGNQTNTLFQCGTDTKDSKQQSMTTRDEAIMKNRPQQIINPNLIESRIGTVKVAGKSKLASDIQINSISKGFVPEHENILKVSLTPKNKYLIMAGGAYYEEERGKCLDEIIQSRYNTTMHFPEYQIVSLLECLVYSLAYLSKKEVNYHDFYPTNIFYNNGNFKILNPMSVQSSGYSLTQNRKRFSFLSPELILEVLNDTQEQAIPQNILDKADVFAIGMIILEFCSLMPSSECYDPETYNIVDEIINQRVEKARQLYNPQIADCIDLMLQYEVDKRIPPMELAYGVHHSIEEMRENEAEMSRAQMSRLSFSQTPQMPTQRVMIVPNSTGLTPERRFDLREIDTRYVVPGSQGGQEIFRGIPPAPFIVGRSPPTGQLVQGPSPISQMHYPPLPIPSHLIPQMMNPPRQVVQKTQALLQQSPPSVSKNSHPFLASETSPKMMDSSSPTLGNKNRLNPFEEIQEDQKQDEESPQKFAPTFGTAKASPNNFVNSNTPTSTAFMYKTREPEKTAFSTAMNTPITNMSSGSYKTTANGSGSISAQLRAREESLDERVKKILEASKNIM